MKTLVIGASENPVRYAHQAARRLLQHGHEIELVGSRPGQIAGHPIQTGQPDLREIDTVTLYVGPRHQSPLVDYVLGLKPRRIIFNPGTENPDFEAKALQAGIEPVEACTLVMLATRQY